MEDEATPPAAPVPKRKHLFTEPSTWASAGGGILTMLPYLSPPVAGYGVIAAGACFLVGFIMRETSGHDQPSPEEVAEVACKLLIARKGGAQPPDGK